MNQKHEKNFVHAVQYVFIACKTHYLTDEILVKDGIIYVLITTTLLYEVELITEQYFCPFEILSRDRW